MHYFRPVKSLRKVAEYIWKFLAARLRLTSYMFGGGHELEEISPKRWSWIPFARVTGEIHNTEVVRDGTFRRVPASDNVVLPQEMRATALVTPDGLPVDDEARELIAAQNMEAERADRVVKDDYTIAYIPPNFRRRVFVFIACLLT